MSISRRIRGERVWILQASLSAKVSRDTSSLTHISAPVVDMGHIHHSPTLFHASSGKSPILIVLVRLSSHRRILPKVPCVRWIFSWSGRNSRSIHAGNPCKDWQRKHRPLRCWEWISLGLLYYHISSSQVSSSLSLFVFIPISNVFHIILWIKNLILQTCMHLWCFTS